MKNEEETKPGVYHFEPFESSPAGKLMLERKEKDRLKVEKHKKRMENNFLYRILNNNAETIGNIIFIAFIFFLYYIGVYYTSIVFMVGSVIGVISFFIAVEKAPGGSYSGIMILPLFFLFIIALIMFGFSDTPV